MKATFKLDPFKYNAHFIVLSGTVVITDDSGNVLWNEQIRSSTKVINAPNGEYNKLVSDLQNKANRVVDTWNKVITTVNTETKSTDIKQVLSDLEKAINNNLPKVGVIIPPDNMK